MKPFDFLSTKSNFHRAALFGERFEGDAPVALVRMVSLGPLCMLIAPPPAMPAVEKASSAKVAANFLRIVQITLSRTGHLQMDLARKMTGTTPVPIS